MYGVQRIDADPRLGGDTSPNVVDVWIADYGACTDTPADLDDRHLSPAERARLQEFAHGPARRTFSIGRLILRDVLASYCGRDPREVPIGIGLNGKPYLAAPEPRLFFNLAHAWPLFAVAVSTGGEIGVDIEAFDRSFDLDLVAPYVLSPSELAEVRSSADPRHAFLTYWAIKEAVSKASSLGLRISMSEIALDASPLADAGRQLTASGGGPGHWFVMPLALGEKGVAAVAMRSAFAGVRLRRREPGHAGAILKEYRRADDGQTCHAL